MNVDQIVNVVIDYGITLLGALVVLLVGLKIIGVLTTTVSKRMEKREVDPSLRPFLLTSFKVLLQVLLVISVASMLGIAMTSFIAVIGAASLAVGLALQGSLANFAGGVLILLLKPFRVGDYIEAAGFAGTVTEIQIFYTLLDTPNNNRIVVPNGILSNNSTINYTVNDIRRTNISVEVSYDDNIELVKETLYEIAANHEQILDDPPPQVVLGEFGENAIVFYYRIWCSTENFWPIYFELMEQIKQTFDEKGISIPYPQRDIHIVSQETV